MFWDSSALVPLLLSQARSKERAALLHRDAAPTIWWGSPGSLAAPALAESLSRLGHMAADMDVVVWAGSTTGEALVCLDERLRDAARREGFSVLPQG